MISMEDQQRLEQLDKIIQVVESDAGAHILEEIKKAEVFNTLQAPTTNPIAGPLISMCQSINNLESEIAIMRTSNDQLKIAIRDVASILSDINSDYSTRSQIATTITSLECITNSLY